MPISNTSQGDAMNVYILAAVAIGAFLGGVAVHFLT